MVSAASSRLNGGMPPRQGVQLFSASVAASRSPSSGTARHGTRLDACRRNSAIVRRHCNNSPPAPRRDHLANTRNRPPMPLRLAWFLCAALLLIVPPRAGRARSRGLALAGRAGGRRPRRTGIRQCGRGNQPSAHRRGVLPGDIHRLSASPARAELPAEPASAQQLLRRIAELPARPGDRCLIFLTSHGERGEGLVLAVSDGVLSPGEPWPARCRAAAPRCRRSSSSRPVTAASFAAGKMAKPNRDHPDRSPRRPAILRLPGHRTYNFFDECLLRALPRIGDLARRVRRSRSHVCAA